MAGFFLLFGCCENIMKNIGFLARAAKAEMLEFLYIVVEVEYGCYFRILFYLAR